MTNLAVGIQKAEALSISERAVTTGDPASKRRVIQNEHVGQLHKPAGVKEKTQPRVCQSQFDFEA
jgi:hypothetical protein